MNSIWIARDASGMLCAFREKPHRAEYDEYWITASDYDYSTLREDWFPDLTWEDEPIELVVKTKKSKQ